MFKKACGRCKLVKSLDDFPTGNGLGGRFGYCRPCSLEYARERRAKNPDLIRSQENCRRERNPEARLAVERRASARRRADSAKVERLLAQATARLVAQHQAEGRVTSCIVCGAKLCALFGRQSRVITCSPACSRVRRLRGKVRKEKVRAHRKRGVCVLDVVDPFVVFDRDGWRCAICGVETPPALRGSYEPDAPELDHVVPLARGGEHSYLNTQCACRRCNMAKGDKLAA